MVHQAGPGMRSRSSSCTPAQAYVRRLHPQPQPCPKTQCWATDSSCFGVEAKAKLRLAAALCAVTRQTALQCMQPGDSCSTKRCQVASGLQGNRQPCLCWAGGLRAVDSRSRQTGAWLLSVFASIQSSPVPASAADAGGGRPRCSTARGAGGKPADPRRRAQARRRRSCCAPGGCARPTSSGRRMRRGSPAAARWPAAASRSLRPWTRCCRRCRCWRPHGGGCAPPRRAPTATCEPWPRCRAAGRPGAPQPGDTCAMRSDVCMQGLPLSLRAQARPGTAAASPPRVCARTEARHAHQSQKCSGTPGGRSRQRTSQRASSAAPRRRCTARAAPAPRGCYRCWPELPTAQLGARAWAAARSAPRWGSCATRAKRAARHTTA